MNPNSNKVCFMCRGTGNMSARPNSTHGIRAYWLCKPCKSFRMKDYYENKRTLVFIHYGSVCNCCGESDPRFLTVDHIDNDGHSERWLSGTRITGGQLYQKIVKANYPSKYQLLCMNCNWGKRMNKGVCPHIV